MAEKIRIRSTSRLRFSRPLNYEGITTWEMPEFQEIEAADDDLEHNVIMGDRLDLISDRYYGTPDLGWLIALANDFEMYPQGLNAGARLAIPSRERVFKSILPAAAKSREGRGL